MRFIITVFGVIICSLWLAENVSAQCTPICNAPLCGQADGCGNLCSDQDDQAAPAPTMLSPDDLTVVVPYDSEDGGVSTKAIDLEIQTQADPSYNAYYTVIEVYPYGTDCTNPRAECTVIASGLSPGTTFTHTFHIPEVFYGLDAGFQWRVWHMNNTCSNRLGEASDWRTFAVGAEVTGQIYVDDGVAGMSGGKCVSLYPAQEYNPIGNDETITVSRSGFDFTAPIDSDGSYSVIVPVSNSGENTVSFSTNVGPDACGCPTGCTLGGIDSPDSEVDFYYQPVDVRDAWWQVVGGSIFAASETGVAIASLIPDTCLGSCSPYILLRDEANSVDSSGTIVTGGGDVDSSNEVGVQATNINQDGTNYLSIGSQFSSLLENYHYFYRKFSLGLNPADDFEGTWSDAQKPSVDPINQRAYFAGQTLQISSPWNVTSSESLVIFVDGDVQIDNTILVEQGGFLSFIVSGDIIFSEDVCQTDHLSSQPVVEGVYVADGTIEIESTGTGDCKFVGAGSFTGLSGMELNRDFRDGNSQDAWNSRNPVELFIHRPDFIVNIPDRMKTSIIRWQETAP